MPPQLSFSPSRGEGSPRPRELSRLFDPRCPSPPRGAPSDPSTYRDYRRENLKVELVDKHHMLTLPEAFFPTFLMANPRTLSAAHRADNPAFSPFIHRLAGFCR